MFYACIYAWVDEGMLFCGKNDLVKRNLKGQVKNVVIKRIGFDNKNAATSLTEKEYCFNFKGNLMSDSYREVVSESKNCSQGANFRNTYDYDGNNRRVLQKHYVPDGILHSTGTYCYDAEGLLKEMSVAVNGLYHYTHFYNYDSRGHLISDTYTHYEFSSLITYSYDENGVLIEKIDLTDDWGTIIWRYTYKYNKFHDLIEMNAYKIGDCTVPEDKLYVKLEFSYKKYDTKGNWTEAEETIFNTKFIHQRKIEYF